MAKKKEANLWVEVSQYSTLAFLLPISGFVGYLIGYALDRAFSTTFLRFVVLGLGILSGIMELIRELQKIDKDP